LNLSSSAPVPLRSLKRPYGSPPSIVDVYGNQPSPLTRLVSLLFFCLI